MKKILFIITVLALSSGLGFEKAEKNRLDIKNVVIVYKTHFDIGFTASAAQVIKMYRTSFIDSALAVLEKSRELPAWMTSLTCPASGIQNSIGVNHETKRIFKPFDANKCRTVVIM